MSVPKRRKSHSAVRQGRSHHSLKKQTLSTCSKCGQAVQQHTACSFCGNYKNEVVLKIKDKTKK